MRASWTSCSVYVLYFQFFLFLISARLTFFQGEEPTEEEIHAAVRKGVIANKFAPVFMGSAFKNKGVQPLIDAVCNYLPSPGERKRVCFDQQKDGEEIELKPDPKEKFVAYVFVV